MVSTRRQPEAGSQAAESTASSGDGKKPTGAVVQVVVAAATVARGTLRAPGTGAGFSTSDPPGARPP